ncbi:MAG: N-acetylmuramoyl-L-alanine amidase [Candidatus Sericytochromatia bacterium]|nr:N-acetylmuramoyl-L-alanine amidase [Candidatus Sericytochromatia bacterium]
MNLLTSLLCLLFLGIFSQPAVAREMRAVSHIFWDAAGDALVIESDGRLNSQASQLENPARYVIDLPGTRMSKAYLGLPGVRRHGVNRVRVGHVNASTVRVVFDLQRAIHPRVETTPRRLLIYLDDIPRAPVLSLPGAQGVIEGIRLQGGTFLVAMSRRRPYWSHVWPLSDDRTRLTLVFPQTILAPGVFGTVMVQSNGVERIIASQRGPDARVEFDCNGTPEFEIAPQENGWLLVGGKTPNAADDSTAQSSSPSPDIVSPSSRTAPLTLRQAGEDWILTLNAIGDAHYTLKPSGEDRLYLDVSGARLTMPRDSVYIDNGLIARVRSIPNGTNKTRLTIDFDQPIKFRGRKMTKSGAYELTLRRSGKSRVTLDPGHGGTDTGTKGRAGTQEKDITLAVASRLAQNLEKSGISVQMTRMRDLEILLRPRVEMANRNQSNVFISIHANSFPNNSNVNGIETYYFNDASYPLARSIHQSLVKSLKRPDRGVRKNNFYVVNHTKMPAALVEIGYLSNPEEEALLKDPTYQEKAAQAIYEGVQQYMNTQPAIH